MTFRILERDSRYPGLTGYHEAPKLAAYAYLARLQSQGRITSTTYHADGAITVESAGLEPMTFANLR